MTRAKLLQDRAELSFLGNGRQKQHVTILARPILFAVERRLTLPGGADRAEQQGERNFLAVPLENIAGAPVKRHVPPGVGCAGRRWAPSFPA